MLHPPNDPSCASRLRFRTRHETASELFGWWTVRLAGSNRMWYKRQRIPTFKEERDVARNARSAATARTSPNQSVAAAARHRRVLRRGLRRRARELHAV